MSNYIKIVNPLDIPDWDQKILSLKNHSFFHSKNWARVLIEAYRYSPRYFTLYRKGELRAVLPMFEVSSPLSGKRGVSLPFTDHCRPLVSNHQDFEELLQFAINKGKQWAWRRIEVRGAGEFMENSPFSANYNLHCLALSPDETALRKSFRSSTQRNIKKAQKQDIAITLETDLAAVKAFFKLNCITRQHHGIPPQPFSFFRSIYRHILAKENGIIVLARHGGQIIAGAMFFHFGRKAMYKYGASRRDFLEIRPNNLIMWEAIKWYGRNGFFEFDMGRSEPDNQGLNQFKRGWGTRVETLTYYTFNIPQMKFAAKAPKGMTAVNRIFQKTPLPILRAVGELAYRHIG